MSAPPDIKTLIQLEIDGALSDVERAALERSIANDPAAREERERMRALAATISGLDRVSPPAGFADGVARAIRTQRMPRRGTWPERLRSLWSDHRRQWAPVVYAVCAGAALVVLGLQAAGRGSLFRAPVAGEAAGTMGAPRAAEGVTRVPLRVAGFEGSAEVRDLGDRYSVSAHLSGAPGSEVVLRFDPALVAVRRASGSPAVSTGTVRWARPADGELSFDLTPTAETGATVEIDVVTEAGSQKAGVIELPGRG
ncbi:MAG TPA: hypothetical protein VMR65_07245 [Candidatus Sulfotelmatobacter sp.]|jgi:anti-sigma factor RsiW|nr:hypothetical protein [Candidatus Sulfotelmatobacter sp.]